MSQKSLTPMMGLEIHIQLNTQTKLFCKCPTQAMKAPWVKNYLENKGIDFKYVQHGLAMRCADSARERNLKASQIAKAMVCVSSGNPVIFILPGDRKLDLEKSSEALNREKIRPATPEEVLKFTGCSVGAVPPTIEGVKKIIDKRLLENELISFNAGNHYSGIIISKKEFLKAIDNYKIAEISSDEVIAEKEGIEKAISGSGAEVEDKPNSRVCEICLGMPGSKPSLNEKAVEMGLKVALALNCKINKEFFFSRKTYFYPDLAKDFQITQFEIPLGEKGSLNLKNGKTINITRVHLEEDPAALVHEAGISSSNYSLIDYNRSGIPLLEIVTDPDMETPEEAREFLDLLLNLLNYLNVFVLGKNVMKADTNVSMQGFERVEVKNVTGFKAVEDALKFEVERQTKLIAAGGKPIRETRSFDETTGKTRSLRTKETEEDYGYIFEPDLPVVEVSEEKIKKIKAELPELPEQKIKRIVKEKGLTEYEARVIVSDFELGKLFDEVSKKIDAKLSAKFLTRELLAILNHGNLSLAEAEIPAKKIISLLEFLQAGKINEKIAKETMIRIVSEKIDPLQYLSSQGLLSKLGGKELEEICKKIASENQKAAQDFANGSEKALNFLVGQAMRAAKGKADAKELQKIFEKTISKK
ncbi:MAG: Asp-tRNA(Asn)/Glu-tRNA(Gln) amidotransferase subunit GatB [Candidatus Diapherotrites archaeon]|nr:Asp-tRNA(Asn)/Glu-tRNA(Gln) amidotransferase subunit GatB [Candidatus Diapherotrites archaeon]